MRNRLYKIIAAVFVLASLSLAGGAILSTANTSLVHADTTGDIQGGVTSINSGGSNNDAGRVPEVIRIVVNILLFFIGAFAVIMIVIAGFRLVTANGDANTVSQARNTILYAVIGLVVAFLAYALVNFVVNQLNPPAASSSSSSSTGPSTPAKPKKKAKASP